MAVQLHRSAPTVAIEYVAWSGPVSLVRGTNRKQARRLAAAIQQLEKAQTCHVGSHQPAFGDGTELIEARAVQIAQWDVLLQQVEIASAHPQGTACLWSAWNTARSRR